MKYLVVLIFALGLVLPAHGEPFNGDQKSEIEGIVKAYLLEHPEVIRDAIIALDAKEKKAAAADQAGALSASAQAIMHSPIDGVVGNPKGDVTIVEFMDYNCGWCKKGIKEVQTLVKGDKNVRVVMKEFPIFGHTSEYAAKAALAAAKQGKYWDMHQALFAATLPRDDNAAGEAAVDKIAKSVGLDVARMKTDMKDSSIIDAIANNVDMAQKLQFTGTPGFIIDNKVFPGYIPLDEMQASLASVRANGGCKVC
jgi:protein-disulfide isomerase